MQWFQQIAYLHKLQASLDSLLFLNHIPLYLAFGDSLRNSILETKAYKAMPNSHKLLHSKAFREYISTLRMIGRECQDAIENIYLGAIREHQNEREIARSISRRRVKKTNANPSEALSTPEKDRRRLTRRKFSDCKSEKCAKKRREAAESGKCDTHANRVPSVESEEYTQCAPTPPPSEDDDRSALQCSSLELLPSSKCTESKRASRAAQSRRSWSSIAVLPAECCQHSQRHHSSVNSRAVVYRTGYGCECRRR